MSDDAQFEAFLRGEDELSRALQAVAQPKPSPELDAVIMKRVRFAQAQRGRQAANDPATQAVPRLSSSAKRWRVPVGIAASVLAGVFATQLYEGERAHRLAAVDPVAQEAIVVTLPPAPPPPAEVMMPTPPPNTRGAPRPIAQAPAAAGTVADSSVIAVTAQPAPPPAPQMAQAPAPVVAASAAPAMDAAGSEERALQRVEVSGSSIRKAEPAPAGIWLARIDALLRAGKNDEALVEWDKFRKSHPDHAVPDAIDARIKTLLH